MIIDGITDNTGLGLLDNLIESDDMSNYSEGLWTPTISFGGNSANTTYSTQTRGSYVKIGSRVSLQGQLELTDKGTSNGNARMGGLPFTIGNVRAVMTIGYAHGLSFSGSLISYGDGNQMELKHQSGGTILNLDQSNFGNTAHIIFAIHYHTTIV